MRLDFGLDIADAILASPIMRDGGFGVFEGFLDKADLNALSDEAARHFAISTDVRSDQPDTEEVRGGLPRRSFQTAAGGEVQESLIHSPRWMDALCDLAGHQVVASGRRGSFNYYCRPGDHLAIHRDVLICDLVAIAALRPMVDRGGSRLRLYPNRIAERLSNLRDNPDCDGLDVWLQPSQVLVMFGGIIPHCLTPILEGEHRVVSIACFRLG
jgi:hypothetical protein